MDTSSAGLNAAWERARARMPCDRCKKRPETGLEGLPTCFGENICQRCYRARPTVIQMYPGDQGFALQPMPAGLSVRSGGG